MNMNFGSYLGRKKLGAGAFGAVYKATKDGKNYALKVVENTDKDALNEVEILRKVSHRRIVTCYDAFIVRGKLCIAMELADMGTLTDYVGKYKPSDPSWINFYGAEWSVWRFFAQISAALDYLHNFQHGKILHRDLKLSRNDSPSARSRPTHPPSTPPPPSKAVPMVVVVVEAAGLEGLAKDIILTCGRRRRRRRRMS